jgi:hypothetical protein
MSAATLTRPQKPTERPFDRIYRDLAELPAMDVQRAIAECKDAGGTITTARVRKTLLPPVKPLDPLPCSDAEIRDQRLSALRDRLARKIARCMNHAGLTEAEEKEYQRGLRLVEGYCYLPSANWYEAECR